MASFTMRMLVGAISALLVACSPSPRVFWATTPAESLEDAGRKGPGPVWATTPSPAVLWATTPAVVLAWGKGPLAELTGQKIAPPGSGEAHAWQVIASGRRRRKSPIGIR